MSTSSNQIDLERAKRELGIRRTEMLQRHAEELSGLDADQAELETLEKLIASFLRKFGGGDQPADETEQAEEAAEAEQPDAAKPAEEAEAEAPAAAAEQTDASETAEKTAETAEETTAAEETAAIMPAAARTAAETPRLGSPRSKSQMTNFEIFSRASRTGSF